MWFIHFSHLFLRIFLRSAVLLGTSAGGLCAQLVTIVTNECRGGFWKPSAWKANWRDGIKRALVPLVAIWGITLVVCTFTTVYHDHVDSTGRWQAVVKEKNSLKQALHDRDIHITQLEGPKKCPTPVQAPSNVVANIPETGYMRYVEFEIIKYEVGQPIIAKATATNSKLGLAKDANGKVQMFPVPLEWGPDGIPTVPRLEEEKAYTAFINNIKGTHKEEGETFALGQQQSSPDYGPVLTEALDGSIRLLMVQTLLMAAEYEWTDDKGPHMSEACQWLKPGWRVGGLQIWHSCRGHNRLKF